jgi:hypothetical protein
MDGIKTARCVQYHDHRHAVNITVIYLAHLQRMCYYTERGVCGGEHEDYAHFSIVSAAKRAYSNNFHYRSVCLFAQ